MPKKLNIKEKLKMDPKGAEEYAKKAGEWVLKGMEEDKKRG